MRKFQRYNLVTLAIVLLLAVFHCTMVYADDTSLGRTPEGVFPIQENDVIMESEEITVDLEKNSVECVFVFHNTGKSKVVFMGFPGKLYNSMEDGLTNDVNLELRNFKTFVKGGELPVTHEKGALRNNTEASNTSEILDTSSNALNESNLSQYSEFFTFSVPFEADEKLTVRNSYNFTPTYDSIGDVFSGYVLQTGGMWKGPIGSAKVTFKLGKIQPYQIERLQMGGFKFVGNDLVWERNNFEPRYDLRLEYNIYRYSAEDLSNLTDDEEKLKQEINQKIDSYNKVKKLADKGETDELLTLYNKAVDERNTILALYIRSYLPSDKIHDEITTLGNISIEKEYNNYHAKCDVLGLEAARIKLNINHTENGKVIQDVQEEGITSYYLGYLTPGVEYNITYTLIDWMDRTEQKNLKYKVPELEEVSAQNQTQPTVSSTISTSSDLKIEPASVSEPANELKVEAASESIMLPASESINEPVNESIVGESSSGSKLVVWVMLGVILVVISVITVMILSRKYKSKL